MSPSVWVPALVGLLVLPYVVWWAIDRCRPLQRWMLSVRERDYPMPRPGWTVGDLRAVAERNSSRTWAGDPRWPTENDALEALLRRLDGRPADEPLTPQDVDAWLTIRDMRGV